MRLFFILAALIVCYSSSAQNNSGFSISVELLNFEHIINWEEVFISGPKPMEELANPTHAIAMHLKRSQGFGKKRKAQFFTYGFSIIYQPATYQPPEIDPFYGFLYPPYLVRSDHMYAGLNVGYEKSFNINKRKRNKLVPFFAVQFTGYYGVWQSQTLQSTQSGEGTFKEPIAADNYFMASVQANVGVQYFFSKKHDKSMKLYLPINYTFNADKSFQSFPVLGFVGLIFDGL